VFFDSFANLLGPHSCLFQWPTRDFVATRAYIQARLKARFPVPEVNDVFDMKKLKDLTLLQPLRLVCKASKNAVDIQIKRIYANVNKQDTQAVQMFHEKEIDVILQEEQENKKSVQKMMHFMLHEFTQETIITKLSSSYSNNSDAIDVKGGVERICFAVAMAMRLHPKCYLLHKAGCDFLSKSVAKCKYLTLRSTLYITKTLEVTMYKNPLDEDVNQKCCKTICMVLREFFSLKIIIYKVMRVLLYRNSHILV